MWTPIPADPGLSADHLRQALKEELGKFANEIFNIKLKELRLQVRKDVRTEIQKLGGPIMQPTGSNAANVNSAIEHVKRRMSVVHPAIADQAKTQSPNADTPSAAGGTKPVATPTTASATSQTRPREEPRPLLRRRGFAASPVKGKRVYVTKPKGASVGPVSKADEEELALLDTQGAAMTGVTAGTELSAEADTNGFSVRKLQQTARHEGPTDSSAADIAMGTDDGDPLMMTPVVANGSTDPNNPISLQGSQQALASAREVDPEPDMLNRQVSPDGGGGGDATHRARGVETTMPLLGGDPVLPDDASLVGKARHVLFAIVNSNLFEYGAGVAVLANAIVLGIEANYQVAAHGLMPAWVHPVEICFALVFTVELLIRIGAVGSYNFFFGEGYGWNVFDTLMVSIQVVDQILSFSCVSFPDNVSVMRTFRVMRILRITRAIRMVRLFDVLTTVVSQMVNSVLPAFWAFVVFMMMVYVFSVFFMAASTDAGHDVLSEDLEVWFGSLHRTVWTLIECLIGGVEWEDVLRPLVRDVSPLMGVLFVVYITVGLFVVMNLVVSVFMHKVMMVVREDKDQKMAKQIGEIFLQEGVNNQITCEDFLEKLKEPVLQEYFKAIDVFPSIDEARGLFDLIDVDSVGSVHADEIVDGILRLRGPARALEVAFLLRATGRICDQLLVQQAALEAIPGAVRDTFLSGVGAHPLDQGAGSNRVRWGMSVGDEDHE